MEQRINLFGVELSQGLVAFQDGVVAEVLGEEELDGGLDVSGGQGLLLLVADQLGGLEGDLVEHVGDQRVDDGHALLGDADVVGDRLQDLVDVDGEGLVVLLLVV